MKTINFFLVFFIVASGVFYFYFKTRQFRTSYVFPIRKKMFASKAGSFLGGLLLFFGINQLILFQGTTTYLVSGLFIVFGAYIIFFNTKATKHYKQFVDEETRLNEN
ncbi:YtpI family protein [Sporosarcina highlanderae]|uniref:YtpI family protein n=1 Tax=Sporosarcina highlanderae TaxID=3035916 RepID=A0ABT8JQ70_9BACL|nr:YtpI family protein [Sporosarcina highlanderae]MDN4607301.1 YtpI family protein [Sporosarcina highlanderae]